MTSNLFENDKHIQTLGPDDTYNEFTAYNDDDDLDGDWDDEEDEVFDDMAADREDLHDVIVEGNIYDEEDDDHLPDEDAD